MAFGKGKYPEAPEPSEEHLQLERDIEKLDTIRKITKSKDKIVNIDRLERNLPYIEAIYNRQDWDLYPIENFKNNLSIEKGEELIADIRYQIKNA